MGNSSGAQREHAFSDSCDDLSNYSISHGTEALEYYNMKRQPPRYKVIENGLAIKRLSDRDEFSEPPSSPSTIPTLFRWTKGGQSVQLMGSFDGWTNFIPLVNCEDEFLVIIELPIGEHQYKFLVDGEWTIDPDEPNVDNGMHSFNNKLIIRDSDFEIFKALKADDKTVIEKIDVGFGQDLPPNMSSHHRPPIIPPQLLQISLNKEAPVPYDPEILTIPQTSELNHLYALSIKGGVITMSSTHRYKKKYITTIFYQPT